MTEVGKIELTKVRDVATIAADLAEDPLAEVRVLRKIVEDSRATIRELFQACRDYRQELDAVTAERDALLAERELWREAGR